MAIPLTGSGSLFQRLGRIWAFMDDVNALRGGPATTRVLSGANAVTRAANILADYAAGTGIQAVADGLYSNLSAWQGTSTGYLNQLKSLCQATLIQMANQDQPLPKPDLPSAMALLVQQMKAAAATVNASAPAVAAPVAVGTPHGNPAIVVSLKDHAGQTLAYVLPETLTLACTGDLASGATLNQEAMSVKGAAALTDTLSHLWPAGSGASLNFKTVDGTKNNAAQNVLFNGDFETWTTPASPPDNWVLTVGVAGTDVFNGGSGNAYGSGTGSLQFTGTAGAVLTALTQQFGIPVSISPGAGGTPAVLAAGTQYALCGFVKVSATPAAGVLEFALVDGTGAVVADDSGTNNLFTLDLTTLTTAWVSVSGSFRTPTVLPSVLKLRVRLSTALSTGVSLYLDRLGMALVQPMYAGGPSITMFAGSSRLVSGDTWLLAASNTFGAVQKRAEMVFGMRALGLQIPSSGSPSVADSVIA
jgi:hypothetical protein